MARPTKARRGRHLIQAAGLTLASASPARRALLQAAGLAFDVRPAELDEAATKRRMQDAPPAAVALALAAAKAAAIAADGVVIGADQILVCEGVSFDKPRDLAEAARHLHALSGRPHTLVTAVACWRDGRPVWQHVATPALTMRPLTAGFIDAYLAAEGADCLGCVGAYRLEGQGIHLFERIEGEHGAILGLPMLSLLSFLRSAGVLQG